MARPRYDQPPPPATTAQIQAALHLSVPLYPGIDRFEADRRLRLALKKTRRHTT